MKSCLSIILIALALLISGVVQAQNSAQNRLKVAYGDATYTTFATSLFSAITGADDVTTSGSFSVGYRRVTHNSRWALGADFNFININQKFDNNPALNSSLGIYSIIPTAELYYMKSGICRLYGTLGVGVSFSEDAVGAAFQFSPIALRVGSNKIAGFVELGVGYKGIANIGVEIGF